VERICIEGALTLSAFLTFNSFPIGNTTSEENQWNNSDGKQILDKLSKVIFELKFSVECDQITFQEYHFINHVIDHDML